MAIRPGLKAMGGGAVLAVEVGSGVHVAPGDEAPAEGAGLAEGAGNAVGSAVGGGVGAVAVTAGADEAAVGTPAVDAGDAGVELEDPVEQPASAKASSTPASRARPVIP